MKSKSHSDGNKKTRYNTAKKSTTLQPVRGDVKSPFHLWSIETHSLELSSEVASTSQNTYQNATALLEPDELLKVNKKVKSLLNNVFQNKSDIVVNRRVLEEIVSETFEHFYSEEDKFKNLTEVKHLTEKFKTLQTEQIKLNRQRRTLEDQIAFANLVIKKLYHEKCLFNYGIIKSKKRQVRSVGLQTCIVNMNHSNDENSHLMSNEASGLINELFVKALKSSCTVENDKVSSCPFPEYPMSPKYLPDIPKPPAPILLVRKKINVETQCIMLTWSFVNYNPQNIVVYQLYSYEERCNRNSSDDIWKKVGGDINAIQLPILCNISQFIEDTTYHFIVRAVDSQNRLGDFSIPASINIQKVDLSPKTV
ncbi:uncharacterized protein [Halyomorpha halys]|uniref:uncharacterized protein n=1 Tax=Halyomorpha halys TaxID=286706 RepID=UPI0006D4F36E|nr:uncharacterized protein LOC106688409 [Halyomorpha halys]